MPATPFYILDDNGTPVIERDVQRWAEWYEKHDEARFVRRDELPGGVCVSTVFLSIDQNPHDRGPPILWETMIFGGPHDGFTKRYSSFVDAIAGHEEASSLARREA